MPMQASAAASAAQKLQERRCALRPYRHQTLASPSTAHGTPQPPLRAVMRPAPHAALAALHLSDGAGSASREPHFLETLLAASDDGDAAQRSGSTTDSGSRGGAARGSGAAAQRAAEGQAAAFAALSDEESDDGSDGDAWQAPGDTWSCGACTYGGNFESDALCVVCGASNAAEAGRHHRSAVARVWRCIACTLDNAAEVTACAACGVAQPPAPPARTELERSRAWPDAPPPRRRATAWSCVGCTLVNAGGQRACCEACGMPRDLFDDSDSAAAFAAVSIDGAAACLACAPRRACPAHAGLRLRGDEARREARELARTDAWLDWERRGLVPLRRDDDEDGLSCVDARTRRATLRAANLPPSAPSARGAALQPPSAEQFRQMYGGGAAGDAAGDVAGGLCLDTRWEEGREPRRRVLLLQAAGWSRVWYVTPVHPWLGCELSSDAFRLRPSGAGEVRTRNGGVSCLAARARRCWSLRPRRRRSAAGTTRRRRCSAPTATRWTSCALSAFRRGRLMAQTHDDAPHLVRCVYCYV